MLTGIYSYKWQAKQPCLRWARTAVATGIFLAYTVPVAMAQAVSPVPTNGDLVGSLPQALGEVSLTLPQAMALALEGNADLAVAQREIEVTAGQLLQGQSTPNPELAYVLEDTRATARTQSVQINWPVEMGRKRAARMAVAQNGRDIAVADLDSKRAEVRAAVGTSFFDALIAQERLLLAKDSSVLAQKATDAVVKRVAAGKVSPVEETKARVAEAGVRVELAHAQSELRSAYARLVSLLGTRLPRFNQVAGEVDLLPQVPAVIDIEQRLPLSPTLRRAEVEMRFRQSLASQERSKQVPDVTLSLGLKRDPALQRDQVLFGVSVPIPVFDRNQGNTLEALARVDKARDELTAVKVRFGAEVWQARERLSAIRVEVDVLQSTVVPGAKSAYDAVVVGFDYGKFNFLEMLDAQRTYFAAKSQYLKALADAHRAAAEIDRLLGGSVAKPPAIQE
jgi:cobalt-zinc-cadmium efflux system outer membrane protein